MKGIISIKHWKAILFSITFISSFVISKQYTDPFIVPKNFFLFFSAGIFLLIMCIIMYSRKETILFSWLDVAIAAFLFWGFLSLLFSTEMTIDNSKFYIYACCTGLYFSLKPVVEIRKKVPGNPLDTIVNILLIIGIVQVSWGFLQYFHIAPNIQKEFRIGGSFGNPGQYTNFLVPVFAFALSSYLFSEKNKKLSFVSALAILAILPFTQARAAWIATLLIIIYLTEKKYGYIRKFWKGLRYIALKIIIIFIITGILFPVTIYLYQLKKNSSSGRLFIWQTSLEMIKDKPLTGFGFDRFAAAHNDYQAKYFEKHPDDTAKAEIADGVNYAFNEFIQAAAETGILGAILLISIFIIAFTGKPKEAIIKDMTHYYGAKAALTALFISSLVSYPFHIVPSTVIFFFSLGVINLQSNYKTFQISTIDRSRKLIAITGIVLISVFLIIQYQRNKAERQWLTAFKYMRENRMDEAYSLYQDLYPDLKNSQYFLFNYGAELSLMKRYSESIRILKEAEPRLDDSDFYIYLASSYENSGNIKEAEAGYNKAMCIMPAKLFPRYRLVGIYLKTDRKMDAVEMAKKIMSMKVKIQSPTTDAIRQEMADFLKKENS